MREDSDRAGQDDPSYDDLLRQHILDQGAGTGDQMNVANPEPPQPAGSGITLPAPGTPLFGAGGVISDQGKVNEPYYNPALHAAPPPPPAPNTQTTPNDFHPINMVGSGGGNTQASPGSAIPPSFGGAAGGAPPTAASQIPPDLLGILNSLKEGITSFQAPSVNIQPQTTPAYDDLVRTAIMDAIRQGQQPVNESDPLISPLLAAVRGQGQRAKESNQADLAERLSARHLLSSGAYDTGVERYNQGVDEATGGTLAQMMTSVLGQRQQRLMQAIQMGSNYLNADQARQLQAELANVSAALDQYKAKSSVGLGTLASLLQNQQFYDSLGTGIGEFASRQNDHAGTF